MKVAFNELETKSGNIDVSFDGGKTYKQYSVNDVKQNGIKLDDTQDFSKAYIKGSADVFKNLDVVNSMGLSTFYVIGSFSGGNNDVRGVKAMSVRSEGKGDDYNDNEYNNDDEYVDDGFYAEAILANTQWIKDKFGLESFNPDNLYDSGHNVVSPAGYSENHKPVFYYFENNAPYMYFDENDADNIKFLKINEHDDLNKSHDMYSFNLYLNDELVKSYKDIEVSDLWGTIQDYVNEHEEEFEHFDFEIYNDSEGYFDEIYYEHVDGKCIIGTIEDKCIILDRYYYSLLYGDITIKIQNRKDHMYEYYTQNVQDETNVKFRFGDVPELSTPEKPFAKFLGWYQDDYFNTPLNLGDIDSDSYIYAKWEYEDVTRKFILEYQDFHMEFEVTKPSDTVMWSNSGDFKNILLEKDENSYIKVSIL